MSKLSQLRQLQSLGYPVPAFTAVTYSDFQAGRLPSGLSFPVAVRSSYLTEDGGQSSQAGQFATLLNVQEGDLSVAIGSVFQSYPTKDGTAVLVQEMIEPDYSGVLFAFRHGSWKLEYTEGLGDALMSGQVSGSTLLLPFFTAWDARWSTIFNFWEGPQTGGKRLRQAFIRLSYTAGQLLRQMEATHGLDIEFAVANGKLWLLQARPITTPEEAEEVLTSANHKEILPPEPSRLMTDIITDAGTALFGYYQDLDPTLPARAFLRPAGGMPWINLSALLDTMVHWGLPTQLVCRSVGAEDFYQVGLRPWRCLAKLPVFFKVLNQQRRARQRIQAWQKKAALETSLGIAEREPLWALDAPAAFQQWTTAFSGLYVGLVTNMQILTGAMSGPVSILQRLGLLHRLAAAIQQKSASTDYLEAFRQWERGELPTAIFRERFGHRGFYESDLGQPRFWEYSPEDWEALRRGVDYLREEKSAPQQARQPLWSRLFKPVIDLIHTREWIRHETMKLFWQFRKELQEQLPFTPWKYTQAMLQSYLRGSVPVDDFTGWEGPKPVGWDMDTFLCNQQGRRLPITVLSNVSADQENRQHGVGVCPGKVKGQVWRVTAADLRAVAPPPFAAIILVADALDPGWVPYFSKVDGVVSYVGGLLSHASIMLREAGVPSITQLPAHITLQTGDWVEIDGQKGTITVL
ncbi:MAG: PEP/pyruvate-binding domain-containing protein [Phaeodactylibacter sp.]|uniref:PEP/pyruvate-binding domain-containing protein n=1 Tax=Phaeodactylibacter sp. TaxID=1940289 RepID=UPI0032EDC2A0